jgi:pimeloyl-ACP methyl ester carboxylesterase
MSNNTSLNMPLQLATELGPYMQAMTGEDWDIVGFDPRGIGKSDPHISCFGSPTSYQLFRTNTVLDHGVDFASDMSEPVAHARLLHGLRQADALTAAQYEMCRVQGGKKLRYVGTTQVARDIDYITTLLEGKDALM